MKRALKQFVISILWSAVKRKAAMEKPTIIAVTGAIGKTSVKEAIALVLYGSGKPVSKTYGNMNTDTGVPLSLLGYKKSPDSVLAWFFALIKISVLTFGLPGKKPYYVVEYSADKPGDIAFLASQLPITDAVITRIVPAHMQSYPKFDDLVKEKFSLLNGLKVGGTAILNADDPVQREQAAGLQKNILWYGIVEKVGRRAGVWASNLEMTERGWKFTINFVRMKAMDSIGMNQLHSFHIQSRVLGRHNVHSMLAAAAVGFQERVPFEKIQQALESYDVPAGRGRMIEGKKGITIIDETYNASPEAVKQGLEMLQGLRTKDRRCVVILGNMNELGSRADEYHAEVATFAANKADFLIFVGPQGKSMRKAALEAGHPEGDCMAFHSPEQLTDKIDQVVKRNDIVYIKGSQNGVKLERAVKKLMEHPEDAATQLVRQ